CQQDYTAPWTF
nr:immunoglobulin light chain junction region [Macaca mulatta]